MDKVIREGAARVGVDLAKHVIQVHAVSAGGDVITSVSEGPMDALHNSTRAVRSIPGQHASWVYIVATDEARTNDKRLPPLVKPRRPARRHL